MTEIEQLRKELQTFKIETKITLEDCNISLTRLWDLLDTLIKDKLNYIHKRDLIEDLYSEISKLNKELRNDSLPTPNKNKT